MTDNTAITPTRPKDDFAEDKKVESKEENSFQAAANIELRATKGDSPKRKIVDSEQDKGLGRLKIRSAGGANENTPDHKIIEDDESVLMLNPTNKGYESPHYSILSQTVYIVGAFLTAGWIAFSFSYALTSGESFSWAPHDLGAFLAGVFAPPALFWLLLSSIRRRADVDMYASSLRTELQSLLFPSEETAKLMNKDIENLCRQAAEVSSASKAVLKSLARARQGLRIEIRDFAGVSKKAEFHISRLAESLNGRATDLITLTEEIEKRTESISEKAKDGAASWEKATLAILDQSNEVEGRLDKGVSKILEAVDRAEERAGAISDKLQGTYDGLNETISNIAGRFQGLSQEFDGHTSGLSEAADRISEETRRLGGIIQDQVGDLEDVTANTVRSMEESMETVRGYRDELERGASSVADQVEKVSYALSNSIEGVNERIADAIMQAEGLENRIEEKANALSSVVKGISKEADAIEQAGKHAANNMTEALSVAISGADSVTSAVRRSVSSLEKATLSAKEQADELIASTVEHVDKLNVAGSGNIEHVKEIVNLLENSHVQIESIARSTKEQVAELKEIVEEQGEKINLSSLGLKDRIESVRIALAQPLKDIQSAVADADSRHEIIEEVLRRRVSDLNEASGKAVDSAENIRTILRGQAQEISTLSGQVAGHARNINEQMEAQKEALNQQVCDSLRRVEGVSVALREQAEDLGEISTKSVSDIEKLRGSISDHSRDISSFTEKAFENLETLDQALGGKISVLKEQAEYATDAVVSIHEAIKITSEEIEPVYMRAIDQAALTHKHFEALRDGFDESIKNNLDRLKQISSVFDERLLALKNGSGEAADILSSSSDHLRDRVSDIENAASSASEKMREISSSLDNQSSDIHLITDQALLKVESVQKVINEQFHELSASVGQAVEQVRNAGEQFEKQSEMVRLEADKVVDGFDVAGSKAREEAKRLNMASQETVENTRGMVASVQKEAENLLQSSQETLFELKQSGDTFAIRAREVSEQMRASLKASESYGQQLKSQASLIAESSVETTDKISKSVSVLTSRMDDISKTATDVNLKVERTRENLSIESERLLSVTSAALESAQDAATTFGKQSEALFKASQDAAHFAKDVRDNEIRVQRTSFMTSAKFIVESLHSLSVDMSRMLEGDVSEKTWKAFQKGDVGVFTQKLLEMSKSMPLDKAREKFSSDSEFRTYIQRFLRQFEEMYEQAVENDHGALLSSTIGSSEVGKLYHFLCSVAGRQSKLSDGSLRTA